MHPIRCHILAVLLSVHMDNVLILMISASQVSSGIVDMNIQQGCVVSGRFSAIADMMARIRDTPIRVVPLNHS